MKTSKFMQKKVNKELRTQFRRKIKSNSQIFIVNFFSSGRVVINTKDFRKELLEIHIPKLEELYDITFDIKGAIQLIQRTSESEPDWPNNNQQDIWNGQDTNNVWNGKDTQNKNHQQNNAFKNIKLQTITNTMNSKQRISYLIGGKKVGEKWLNFLQATKFFLDEIFPRLVFFPRFFFTWQRIYPDFSYPELLLLFPIYLQNLLLPFFLMYFKHF